MLKRFSWTAGAIVVAACGPTASGNSRPVIAKAPVTDDSAEGAAAVVQTYYALLEASKYAAALKLWDAPGLTLAAFTARYAPYRNYHAQIGAPGRVDAGAGQRYVDVPVRIHGTQREDGRDFEKAAKVTLHRVADIDGASAEQRHWRIRASTAEPGAAAFR